MTVEFRLVREEDFPVIAEIYNYFSFPTTATFHDGAITRSDLQEDFPPGHRLYRAYLILDAGTIPGYRGIRRYKKGRAYAGTAEISVYLKEEYTGKGIGKIAVRYLENQGERSGIRVLLGTVTSENHASTRLFEAMGYSRCAYLKNIGELSGKVLDVVLYQKELVPIVPDG